jgi:hypothetical protein
LRLERQEIDNFEIIGSIRQAILEQEYINSIEIVERNSIVQRHRDSLDIEYMDDLQISPNRNEVRFMSVNVQAPRQNYEIETVDDIEIIGSQENYEVEQIDRISLQDKVIQNRYEQREDVNIRSSEEYNINYNDNRLKRPGQQEYTSEENENILRYRDDNYNMNIRRDYDSNEQERYKIIKREQYIHEQQDQEHIYEREDWNRNNNIQQINNIFIPQQRNSQNSGMGAGYSAEQSIRNNWNEKNRTQGIVNLSVIDDNKKQPWELEVENDDDMVENKESSDEDPKDEENNQQNNRQIRQIHQDYDTDEINDIDPLTGLQRKKNKEKEQFQPSTSNIIIKKEHEQLIDEEEDPKDIKEQDRYQPSSMSYMYSQKGKAQEVLKEKKLPQKYQPSSIKYKYGHESERQEQEQEQEEEEDPKDKKDIGKYQIGSSYKYGYSGRDEGVDIKERKSPGQYKSPSQNYMISKSQSQIKGEDKNKNIYSKEKKGEMTFKPTSVNYMISHESRREDPKVIVNQPKTQGKYQYRSKEITGMMKKKPKVKNIEYIRDPSHSQNFQ